MKEKKIGGDVTLARHGKEHFSRAGRRGAAATHKVVDMKEVGRRGGIVSAMRKRMYALIVSLTGMTNDEAKEFYHAGRTLVNLEPDEEVIRIACNEYNKRKGQTHVD
jgi:hypothetical protein